MVPLRGYLETYLRRQVCYPPEVLDRAVGDDHALAHDHDALRPFGELGKSMGR